MRRGHFIILVGGAVVLFVLLIFAEVLSLVDAEQGVPEPIEVADVDTARSLTTRLPGVRGDISDREGRLLASTALRQRFRIYLDDLVDFYGDSLGKSVPQYQNFVSRGGEREMVLEPDAFAVVHELLVAPLREHEVVLELRTEPIQEHYRSRSGEPFFLEVGGGDMAERGGNFDLADWAASVGGVSLEEFGKRIYPEGAITGTAVGVIDLTTEKGMRGAEMRLDGILGGQAGEVVTEIEGTGAEKVSREISRKAPVRGEDITLALDLSLQEVVWEAMTGVGTGAAVVLDARSGEVLVDVSKPGYDPNEVLAEGMGRTAGVVTDESVESRRVSGVAPLLAALVLMRESGGDEALVDGLVKQVLEAGEGDATHGQGAGELAGFFGMRYEEGAGLEATPMAMALLGAAMVNGGAVLEPQVRRGGVTGEPMTKRLVDVGIRVGELERLAGGFRARDGARGESAVWLSGSVGDLGIGRWVVFATVGEGRRYSGCVMDTEGTSLSLKAVGQRVFESVLE